MPVDIDSAIITAGRLEHHHEAVTIDKASANLTASILRFGAISVRKAAEYLREQGIPVDTERT